nr:ATP-binding protein [Bacillus suaedae]
MSIRSKILSVLLLITLLLSGFSLILVQSISDVNQVSLTIRDEHVPSIVWLTHTETELIEKEQFVRNGIVSDFCCQFIDGYNELEEQIDISVPSSLNAITREVELLDFFINNEVQGFLSLGDIEAAKRILDKYYLPRLLSLKEDLNNEKQLAYTSIQENTHEFTNIIESSLSLLVILTIGAIILSIYFSYRTSAGLTLPIENLIHKVNRIAKGEYGLTISDSEKQFELKQLTTSINQMSLRLKESFETILIDKTYREQILNSLPVGIITIDDKTDELFLNHSAKYLLHGSEEQIRSIDTIPVPCVNKDFWSILSSKKICENVRVTYQSDLENHKLLVSQSKLRDQHNEVIGRTFYFVDITETEKLENRIHQTEKLALVGEMAAGAAHEIRNPLAVIQGFLMLMNQNIDSDQQEMYRMPLLMKELERINFIIEEMLLLAKPGAPLLKLTYLEDVMKDILPLIRESSEGENVNITVDLKRVPLLLDAKQMKQVLYNLVRNSSESMNFQGDIQIYAKVGTDYEIYIEDQGSGISADKQATIFEPFSTTKESGTGLGLTIVKRIIENHNGQIDLISSSNKGTVFCIKLPIANEKK